MDVHPYYGPGNVAIDSCSACNLVWLDFGELRQITHAPGQDCGYQASGMYQLNHERTRARGRPRGVPVC